MPAAMVRFISGLLEIIIFAAPVLASSQRELQDATVTEIVASDPDLSELGSLLATAGLADALSGNTSITLFAPTDAAFAALPDQVYLAKLRTAPYAAHLQSLLRLHFVGGSLPSSGLIDGVQVEAENGEKLIFNVGATNEVMIDSPQAAASTLLKTDIQAANGVVHKVDGVLLPGFIGLELPDLSNTGSFGIFAQLFEESGIAAFIGNIEEATGLFPIDDAYSSEEVEFYRANTAGESGRVHYEPTASQELLIYYLLPFFYNSIYRGSVGACHPWSPPGGKSGGQPDFDNTCSYHNYCDEKRQW